VLEGQKDPVYVNKMQKKKRRRRRKKKKRKGDAKKKKSLKIEFFLKFVYCFFEIGYDWKK
jgi:hypothetical protein